MSKPTATATVHHRIEVEPGPHLAPLWFEFESRDIGATQGTTIRYEGTLVGHFRPGTRYWSRALDVAVEVLVETANRVVAGSTGGGPEVFIGTFAEVLRDKHCGAWDGEDPAWEDE